MRDSFRRYVTGIWQRREYMTYVASSELRAQRMGTFLGNLWHILNPALQITVTYIIFGLVLKVSRGVDNYIAFLCVGIFAYQFTTRSATKAARSIVGNGRLIKSFVFPRAMLPLTSAISSTFSFLPTVLIMFAVPLVMGEPVLLRWLAVPAIIALQVVFNTGLGFITARATYHVPDVAEILPFIFRLGFYASGVIFLVDAYVQSRYRWLFIANPLYCIVALYRWAILGFELDGAVLPSMIGMSIVFLVGGFAWFWQAEDRYARG